MKRDGGAEAYLTPEARARIEIDTQLEAAGWVVRDCRSMNVTATAPGSRVAWIYDFRTNKHFTMKTNPLQEEEDLDEFVEAYRPGARSGRVESDRFRRFTHDELIARDKVSLDITWLKDDSLADPDSLPEPAVLIAEIHEEMKAILRQFEGIAAGLGVGLEDVAEDPVA